MSYACAVCAVEYGLPETSLAALRR